MDPTSVPAGQANVVSQLDLRALDVIGWNRVVPEPTSLSLLGVCVFLGPFVSRRREG